VNFGIIEPLGERIRNKREKNLKIAQRSLDVINEIIRREDFKL
jgi:methylenetetrahydrofolate--tRNA-(uracil-5-)-methyltransferase